MRPICEYCNGCKKQQLLQDLYAGIAMDVRKVENFTRPICGCCNGC